MKTRNRERIDASQLDIKDTVVAINRVTKVVKGGKNMSFSALVVVGDPGAKIVGFGTGKAKEVPAAGEISAPAELLITEAYMQKAIFFLLIMVVVLYLVRRRRSAYQKVDGKSMA